MGFLDWISKIFSDEKKPEPAARPSTSQPTFYKGVQTAPSRSASSYSQSYNGNTYSTGAFPTTSTTRGTPAASTTYKPTSTGSTWGAKPGTTASTSRATAAPSSTYNTGSGYGMRTSTTTAPTARAPTATYNSASSTYSSPTMTSQGYSRTGYDDPYAPYNAPARAAASTTARPAPRPSTVAAPQPAPAPVVQREYFPEDVFARLSLADREVGTPVYTLSVGKHRVCVFEPAREKFMEKKREQISLDVKENEIYHASAITLDQVGELTTVSALRCKQYLQRFSFVYGTVDSYRELILPALLLGSRVRDFEQRCATVVQMGDLVLNMPAQNRQLKSKPLKLRTISGQIFEIDVKNVQKNDTDKRWIVECHPPTTPLPYKVRQGCLLEIMGGFVLQPRVTGALMRYHESGTVKKSGGPKYQQQQQDKTAPIANSNLLSCIYGERAKRDYPQPASTTSLVRLANLAGVVELNPEQAEAVARYNEAVAVCPAFVVESPPGSGKTMTAAAMALSYYAAGSGGVQLFLSTANVPVINMALQLAKLDYGSLKAVHLISSEKEELMTEETRSPFSQLSLARADVKLNEKITKLEEQLKYAPNEEEKTRLKQQITSASAPVLDDNFDVYFATVDMILGRLFKPNKGGRHVVDYTKKQLMNNVKRVVVDEASQLTESALNALILCFPNAQIVLIGDSKQLPPFRYEPGDVVSELAARPALVVAQDKSNLPVIRLNQVYRASRALMAHYSNVFYEGKLHSDKRDAARNPLACFGARSGGARCLFWKVKGVAKNCGTSKMNWGEISTLKHLVNMLKNSGHDEKSVMIISYYEAQRKKAEDELPEGYEVLTVDSAQGREKKIVIVLTTRTSVPTEKGAFFNCALRCNVAVSRHQEALIVVGHPDIAAAPNWTNVLAPKYFRHVEDRK